MKLDFSHVDIPKGLAQIPKAIKVLLDTPAFIKKHQLWKGFLDHSWVLIFSIVVASAFTHTLYRDVHDYFFSDEEKEMEINIATEDIDTDNKETEKAMDTIPAQDEAGLEAEKQTLVEPEEIMEEDHKPLFSSSLKFLLLIFLEVLIYHFAVKTNNILKKTNKRPKFKEFSAAQIRMIKVMGRKWVLGLIMYILVSIVCGITQTGYLKDAIMFLIYGYYLGFAFLDNYLEQFHFSIKDSVSCIQTHFGAATVFGIFTSIVMYVPLIGPLIVPFLCAIAATRYGHLNQMESFNKWESN